MLLLANRGNNKYAELQSTRNFMGCLEEEKVEILCLYIRFFEST